MGSLATSVVDTHHLISFPVEGLVAGAMVFARLGGVVLTMPGFANVPPTARLGVVLPLTVILYPVVADLRLPETLPVLIVGMAVETAIGMAVGMVMSVLVSALTVAGEMASVNIGLHISAMLDPLTGNRADAIGSLTSMMGIGLFLTTDTHLHCIAVLGESLRTLPPGSVIAPGAAAEVLMLAAVTALETGVALAGPVIAFSFLIHLAISLLGRMAPNLNLFFSIGLSLNVAAGLIILMIALPTMAVSFLPVLSLGAGWIAQLVGIQ